MPLKYDCEKSTLFDSLADLTNVCDEVVVLRDLGDRSLDMFPGTLKISEILHTIYQDRPSWNDWVNRVTLLVRAARLGCDFVMWLDDDERLGPDLTSRERIRNLCDTMARGNFGQVIVRVRHLWNETHWRCDDQFGQSFKTFLQPNPFVTRPDNINFKWGPEQALHHFPNLSDASYEVNDYIIHHGHKTRSLREKSVRKYAEHDPDNKHSCVRYDWLLDETGIQLKPIHDPATDKAALAKGESFEDIVKRVEQLEQPDIKDGPNPICKICGKRHLGHDCGLYE
jgi:hypothetical protein